MVTINTQFHLAYNLSRKKQTKNFVNDEKGKSRCSDGERILKCEYFIAGSSNPAVVPLVAQAHVIFNHKIVLK